MSKVLNIAAGLAVVPMLAFSTPVLADSAGQLSNGPTNYKVKNVTKNTDYAQVVAATCGDNVKYSITIAESDFAELKDVNLKANLSTGAINISATTATGGTTAVDGSAKVNVDKGILEYVNGSTVRVDVDQNNNNKQTTTKVGDGVANGGVNLGNLPGSSYMFAQFDAKVKCDTPKDECKPGVPKGDKRCEKPEECKPGVAKGDKRCETAPAELTKTGPASTVALFAGVATVATLAYNLVLRRQNGR